MLPSGKSSPFRYKTEKNISFLCIDAGHLEVPRVDPRGDGGGVGHDGTDAGYPVGLESTVGVLGGYSKKYSTTCNR